MANLDSVPTIDDGDAPRVLTITRNRSDVIFRTVVKAASASTLVIMALIALFLVTQSWDAISEAGSGFFTKTDWSPGATPPVFGVVALMYGTVMVAVVALVVAMPFAVAMALFINEYAPPALRRPLTAIVDLLAAIPSLLYGMWGLFFLLPKLDGPSRFLADHLGFIPFFHSDSRNFGHSYFVAGIVVALMILPIITSISREVFAQAPRSEVESALALGGTRWGTIRTVILPFGRGGMIGGAMLGLGRALGETIAVKLILARDFNVSPHILESGGTTISSLIASTFGESKPFEIKALMAAGLALFVVTLLVNMAASIVVSRSRSGAGVEL